MRQCPNCKSDNPDDARFCNYCGMRLPESKEETLYNDLEGLEKARKVEFSDQEIAEESEKVIDEAKKLFEPEWSGEPEENDGLKKQLTIPENLDHMIEEVTREELEQELHRKIIRPAFFQSAGAAPCLRGGWTAGGPGDLLHDGCTVPQLPGCAPGLVGELLQGHETELESIPSARCGVQSGTWHRAVFRLGAVLRGAFTAFWPQVVLFEESNLHRLQNAVLFCLKYGRHVLGAAALQLVWWLLFVLFLPWTGFLVPFLGVWFIWFVCFFLLYNDFNAAYGIEEKINQQFPEQTPRYDE